MQRTTSRIATNRKGRAGLLLAAAAALVAAAVAVAGGGDAARGAGAAQPAEFTLSLKEHGERIVDNLPKNRGNRSTAGDTVAFNKVLLDQNGKRVGSAQAHGTITAGGKNATATVEGGIILKGGTLAVQETTKFSDRVHNIAITGGTGTYEGATGSITSGLPGQDEDGALFRVRTP